MVGSADTQLAQIHGNFLSIFRHLGLHQPDRALDKLDIFDIGLGVGRGCMVDFDHRYVVEKLPPPPARYAEHRAAFALIARWLNLVPIRLTAKYCEL